MTNSFLMRNGTTCFIPSVVLAATQTGRGRLGRSYVFSRSPSYFRPSSIPNSSGKTAGRALPVGIAVARVLERKISGIRLKWPNDVLVETEKSAGFWLKPPMSNQYPPNTHPGNRHQYRRNGLRIP